MVAVQLVKKALLLTNNRLELAMDWLLEHADDPSAAEPLTEEQLRDLARRHRRRQRVNLAAFRPTQAAASAAAGSSGGSGAPSGAEQPPPPSRPEAQPQAEAQPEQPPPAQLVDTLVEMGFERQQSAAALRAFGNNMEMACHWLLTAGSRPGVVPPPPPTQRQRPPAAEPRQAAHPSCYLATSDSTYSLSSIQGHNQVISLNGIASYHGNI